jgi:hypothetical protein
MHGTANVLADAVIDRLMAGKHAADPSAAAVAHYIGRGVKLFIQIGARFFMLTEVTWWLLYAHGGHVVAADAAAALD